ncbi:Outer membrane protein assembly factor BamB, contains PQQ-like beta-propeller repeat [Caminicella sporogenes DSM 14501]|uniref:Outer membrane protein assembly factor BamB, contains PQQ-like beta-propeller repeat n=1 Tax=Caminicella sporogenes DSM 14501 TaxID=1121266 RepID=A0A1M6SAH9_9FIRM|nr:PQQ-binding-like beta-propeller repeat protein [Caminicella sporogenes]RKD26932.1 hypothetical protein BET04_10005 [Caminicella sporogenes]SHK41762.1 Outer membrane protein assembly factor BamB, contains PQQ-like beta-propeller repeat [Caminicella sporogenes DSM 14501]
MLKRNKSFVISLVVVMLFTLMPMNVFADWTQFQGDIVNSGVTTDKLPTSSSITADWITKTESAGWFGIDTVPLVIGDNAYVFASSNLYKINISNGRKVWEIKVDSDGGFQLSTPATDGSNIYLGVQEKDKTDNKIKLKVKKVSNLNGTPNVTELAVLSEGGQLNTPITYDNGKLYFGTWKGTVDTTTGGVYYCVDANNGNILWKYTGVKNDNREDGFYWAGAAIVGNYIIFGNDASYIHVLDKNNGTEKDKFDLRKVHTDSREVRSSICVYDNSAYFTDKGGYLWKLNINSDGTLKYEGSRKIGYTTSTPVVAYHKDMSEDRIYVGQGQFSGGKLVCYDTNLNLIWEYTGIGGVQSSPIVYSDGVYNYIYFTENSAKGRGYCIMDEGYSASLVWVYTPPRDEMQNYTLQGMAPAGEYVVYGNDSGYVFGIKEETLKRAFKIEPLVTDIDKLQEESVAVDVYEKK